ncbi:HAMP domain-containing sensor histidine kinase [Actinomadura sp. KC216]|uniref:sensor histidine kinase n=1 Tax=Actinomadura sp. KC216 TaxID=2530370 RepID=UPI001FB62489|nr:HAMP domain-containing sensor histidine kinase [Actinomadura sp. KC216]
MDSEDRSVSSLWRRPQMRYSVRGRATLLTVAVSAVILMGALPLAGWVLRDWFRNQSQNQTERTVEHRILELKQGARDNPLPVGEDEADLIQVVAPDGRVLAASPEMRGRPALVVPGGSVLVNRKECPRYQYRCVWAYGVRLSDSVYRGDVMVIAASPLPLLTGLPLLVPIMLLFLLAVLALIAGWTWRTVGLALNPVERIRAEMSEIEAGDLSRRVPVPHGGGILVRLAETVNDTLARLEESSGRERRFISDASHDLRNPISGLQMRLEVALGEPEDHQLRPMVQAALVDVGRLTDIVEDLLELSRLDSRAPLPVERVDLARLVRREVERRSAGVTITTRLESGVFVRAAPVRLARVLNNLLSNAERHAESRVEVALTRERGQARLEVLDDGAGIAEDARERVFERFARLAESRDRDPRGTGLGLPIAREIAEMYGGTLTIQDSRKGARFVMSLPLDTE